MSRKTSVNTVEFLRFYSEGLSDWKIGLLLGVSRDSVYRLRHRLIASGELVPRHTHESKVTSKTILPESNHKIKVTGNVLSACSEVENMLRDKDARYVKGFEDGARWRLELSGAK
jgi:hypothetical protein